MFGREDGEPKTPMGLKEVRRAEWTLSPCKDWEKMVCTIGHYFAAYDKRSLDMNRQA
jgi:hypothetical protein